MSTQTPSRPRTRPGRPDEGTHTDPPVRVVVLNDDHNSFDHVIATFMSVLSWSEERAGRTALRIHETGRGVVFSGHLERAEHIHVQLRRAGLTLEPLM